MCDVGASKITDIMVLGSLYSHSIGYFTQTSKGDSPLFRPLHYKIPMNPDINSFHVHFVHLILHSRGKFPLNLSYPDLILETQLVNSTPMPPLCFCALAHSSFFASPVDRTNS